MSLLCWRRRTPRAVNHAEREEDEAVGASVNYVFATDLGSGVYDLDGRTLQIYQLTYRKELREATPEKFGVEFELPVTFGFFDFKPVDVLSEGIPTPGRQFQRGAGRVARLSYCRETGTSSPTCAPDSAWRRAASTAGCTALVCAWRRTVTSMAGTAWRAANSRIAGVEYRDEVPNDRLRAAAPGIRPARAGSAGRSATARSSSACTASSTWCSIPPPSPWRTKQRSNPSRPSSASRFATRPRYRIWRFDAPRLGFGYRLAGTLSGWRFVIGEPF